MRACATTVVRLRVKTANCILSLAMHHVPAIYARMHAHTRINTRARSHRCTRRQVVGVLSYMPASLLYAITKAKLNSELYQEEGAEVLPVTIEEVSARCTESLQQLPLDYAQVRYWGEGEREREREREREARARARKREQKQKGDGERRTKCPPPTGQAGGGLQAVCSVAAKLCGVGLHCALCVVGPTLTGFHHHRPLD